ncbi:MAG: hypothetical protein R2865_06375 [Deinococcales bacterium]
MSKLLIFISSLGLVIALNACETTAPIIDPTTLPKATIATGNYRLVDGLKHNCINSLYRQAQTGTEIVSNPCQSDYTWRIEALGNSSVDGYRLLFPLSDKVIEAASQSPQLGQWQKLGYQKWLIYTARNQPGYHFVDRQTNTCLSVDGSFIGDNAPLKLASCDGNPAQIFQLEPPPPNPQTLAVKGEWRDFVEFPIVPVAAAMLPNGKIMMWSAFDELTFGGNLGYTQTALYDPLKGTAEQRTVSNAHDMFCPGTSLLADGKLIVNGGSSNLKTSLYDFEQDLWVTSKNMHIRRGYNSSVTLASGEVFTIGGSWGVLGTSRDPQKNGELWNPLTRLWTLLPGAKTDPMLDQDSHDDKYSDMHPWIYAAPNGKDFFSRPHCKYDLV